MEGGENHKIPTFWIEVNVPRGGRKLAVLRLRPGSNLQRAVEATVDLHCKTVCLRQVFGDNIFSIVDLKRTTFECFTIFIFMKFSEDGPPLPLLRSLH
jgi:hypothetical protein